MKIVALMALLKALDEELSVLGKLGKVFHISYGHAAAFDNRFKVREKLWAIGSFVSGKLSKEADRVRGDMSGDGGGGGGGGGRQGFAQPTYQDQQEFYGGRRPPPTNPGWGGR